MRLSERYEILGSLGQGGAAEVLQVKDRWIPGPTLALKRLSQVVDSAIYRSLEREFSVLASISLPGVARVVDFGFEDAEGEHLGGPFFTRVFVPGQPLDAALQGKSPEDVVHAFMQACSILAALHRRGVLHGDIKPANILMDDEGRVHIIDFGLAVAYDRGGAQIDSWGGTFGYLAPERLSGSPPSIATDVYALGATLKRVMSALGATPLLNQKLHQTLQELSTKALQSDPQERPSSMLAMFSILSRWATKATLPVEGFVPPRPRGQEAVLQALESFCTREEPSFSAEPTRKLRLGWVIGETGSGRSTLLRQLKWRLQMSGAHVCELLEQENTDVIPRLERQMSALADKQPDQHLLWVQRIRELFRLRTDALPVVWMLDDFDQRQASALTVIYELLGTLADQPLCVIVATNPTASPLFVADERFLVPRLDADALASMLVESVGFADGSVVRAIEQHTQGIAASVLHVLSKIESGQATTASDIANLEHDHAGRTLMAERLRAVQSEALPLVQVMALCREPLTLRALGRIAQEKLDMEPASFEKHLAELEAQGFIARQDQPTQHTQHVALSDAALHDYLIETWPRLQRQEWASDLLAMPWIEELGTAELGPVVLGCLALQSPLQQGQRSLRLTQALQWAEKQDASRLKLEFLKALSQMTPGPAGAHYRFRLSEVYYACGEYKAVFDELGQDRNDERLPAQERLQASLLFARALISSGQYVEARSVLEKVPAQEPGFRIQALREKAKMELRCGNYTDVLTAVDEGLKLCGPTEICRIELLTSLGMVHSYRSEHGPAQTAYQEALHLAEQLGTRKDEANVWAYLAIEAQRQSQWEPALEGHKKSLAIARGMDDVGSMAIFALNVGTVSFHLGKLGEAFEHYQMAIRFAQRSLRNSTSLMARLNLAALYVNLGQVELALASCESAKKTAEALRLPLCMAHASAVEAEGRAHVGEWPRASALYQEARERYQALNQPREEIECWLDECEVLLDLGKDNVLQAQQILQNAQILLDKTLFDDLQDRFMVLRYRAYGVTQDGARAESDLHSLLARVKERRDVHLEWRVLKLLARIAHSGNAKNVKDVAEGLERQAFQCLENMTETLPREMVAGFWKTPERFALKKEERKTVRPPQVEFASSKPDKSTSARTHFVLDALQRLGEIGSLEELLHRTLELAKDAWHVDHALVLLTDETGNLQVRAKSFRGTELSTADVRFSRSIAEAVLVDAEPIVTLNAQEDKRLRDYHSVHLNEIHSVACFPIRTTSKVYGVLYLGQYTQHGSFHSEELPWMETLARQMGLVVENVSLRKELQLARTEQAKQSTALSKTKMDANASAETAEDALQDRQDTQSSAPRPRTWKALQKEFGIVGSSASIQYLLERIERLRFVSISVVLEGETGTGKELFARAIHKSGPLRNAPFVVASCGAMTETLLEAEFFGHRKGAFTDAHQDRKGLLAQAEGGTLLLDEVEHMSPKLQVLLLRVIENGTYRPLGANHDEHIRVRFLCATQVPLETLVSQGRFRQDLYYRLGVIALHIPPLRERKEDIASLAAHILARLAQQFKQPRKRLGSAALETLQQSPLAGNVRELEHILLRAFLESAKPEIEQLDILSTAAPLTVPVGSDTLPSSQAVLEEERQKIAHALRACRNNRVQAAKLLGIPRRTLYRRLKEYGLE